MIVLFTDGKECDIKNGIRKSKARRMYRVIKEIEEKERQAREAAWEGKKAKD